MTETMPTPGSHSHDVKQSHLRRTLEEEGLQDEEAEARARYMTNAESEGTSPAARDDRAKGPLGSSDQSGDAGAVIDLRSPAFSGNTLMPDRLTKSGDDRSPELEWDSPPEGTVELALACQDRDAPGGSFVHWLVTGISPEVTSVAEGSAPAGGVVHENSFGDEGYGGPLPPVGDDPHRYFFRLFALDEPSTVDDGMSPDDILESLEGADHLASGTLVGLYAR